MATLKRYNSFDELKNSEPASKSKKKSAKETAGQKAFRLFGELVRKNVVSTPRKP